MSGSPNGSETALVIGAAGIIVPEVNSADYARRIVQTAKYAPGGPRGLGIARMASDSRSPNAGMPLGILGLTADAVRPYIDQGFTMIVDAVDTVLLDTTATALVAALRKR